MGCVSWWILPIDILDSSGILRGVLTQPLNVFFEPYNCRDHLRFIRSWLLRTKCITTGYILLKFYIEAYPGLCSGVVGLGFRLDNELRT